MPLANINISPTQLLVLSAMQLGGTLTFGPNGASITCQTDSCGPVAASIPGVEISGSPDAMAAYYNAVGNINSGGTEGDLQVSPTFGGSTFEQAVPIAGDDGPCNAAGACGTVTEGPESPLDTGNQVYDLGDASGYVQTTCCQFSWFEGGGASVSIAPGAQVAVSVGPKGGYVIGGAGIGEAASVRSTSVNLPLPQASFYHGQSTGYQGGLGFAVNYQVGAPVFQSIDSYLGTSLFTPLYIKGPAGLDITYFVNTSGDRLDVDIAPVIGEAGVAGVGYDTRH